MLVDRALKTLRHHAARLKQVPMARLFGDDTQRGSRYQLWCDAILIDICRQHIDDAAYAALHTYARTCQLQQAINDLFDGRIVNSSEAQPALHMALRGGATITSRIDGVVVADVIADARQQMATIVDKVHGGIWRGFSGKRITDVVNLGVGGSDVGARAVLRALVGLVMPGAPRAHCIATLDGAELAGLLPSLNPETTLFIVCSKSFRTEDTMVNAANALAWMMRRTSRTIALRHHFIGVSADAQAMRDFGIVEENALPMWSWVGGRYSLWSAAGLIVAMAIGNANFASLLEGACCCDQHFRTAVWSENMVVAHGLLGFWNASICDRGVHAILPYDADMVMMPLHWQQLFMESLGKSVTVDGQPVHVPTCPVVIGGVGTNAQHAYFQLFHQGTRDVSLDFILTARSVHEDADSHKRALYHALAQAYAFAFGVDDVMPEKRHVGNVPNTIIALPRIDAYHIGFLLALYEHSVFVQSVLMNVNAFDQWGVQLGKQWAAQIVNGLDKADDISIKQALRGALTYLLDDRHD